MSEAYAYIGGVFLFAMVGSGILFVLTRRVVFRQAAWSSTLVVAIMLVIDIAFDITPPPKSAPPPKVETPVEKPKPKVEVPAESFYAEAYDGIAKLTGMRVTERWLLEFGEHIAANGNVDVRGQVELNNDGVKRPFWMLFDGTTRQILRLKIGADLIYSAVGW